VIKQHENFLKSETVSRETAPKKKKKKNKLVQNGSVGGGFWGGVGGGGLGGGCGGGVGGWGGGWVGGGRATIQFRIWRRQGGTRSRHLGADWHPGKTFRGKRKENKTGAKATKKPRFETKLATLGKEKAKGEEE